MKGNLFMRLPTHSSQFYNYGTSSNAIQNPRQTKNYNHNNWLEVEEKCYLQIPWGAIANKAFWLGISESSIITWKSWK